MHILTNQEKLDKVLANQATIENNQVQLLANQDRIFDFLKGSARQSARDPRQPEQDPGEVGPLPAGPTDGGTLLRRRFVVRGAGPARDVPADPPPPA
jgi:hypothetical protein